MQFHGIDAQGKLYDQRLAGVGTWTPADEGRIAYNQTDKTLYYATDSQWVPLFIFRTISVSGQPDVIAANGNDILTLVSGSGITITTDGTAKSVTISGGYSFGQIAVSGQSSVLATAAGDTLTLAAGTGISLTTNPSLKTVTITGTNTFGTISVPGQSNINAPSGASTLTIQSGNSGLSITTTPSTSTLTFTNIYASSSAPTTPAAGMFYLNTTDGFVYMRNLTNTSWIKLFHQDRVPLDRRDGGTFDAYYLNGYQGTSYGATLGRTGNYIQLLNTSGSQISSVIAPYADNADTLDTYHATTFGSSIDLSGSTLRLKNPSSTVISSVNLPLKAAEWTGTAFETSWWTDSWTGYGGYPFYPPNWWMYTTVISSIPIASPGSYYMLEFDFGVICNTGYGGPRSVRFRVTPTTGIGASTETFFSGYVSQGTRSRIITIHTEDAVTYTLKASYNSTIWWNNDWYTNPRPNDWANAWSSVEIMPDDAVSTAWWVGGGGKALDEAANLGFIPQTSPPLHPTGGGMPMAEAVGLVRTRICFVPTTTSVSLIAEARAFAGFHRGWSGPTINLYRMS